MRSRQPSISQLLPFSLKLGRQSVHCPRWYLTHPCSMILQTPSGVRQYPQLQATHLYSLQVLQLVISQLPLASWKGRQHSLQIWEISLRQPKTEFSTQKLLIRLKPQAQSVQVVLLSSEQLTQLFMACLQMPLLRQQLEAQLRQIPLESFSRQPIMLDSWHFPLIRQRPVWQFMQVLSAALWRQQSSVVPLSSSQSPLGFKAQRQLHTLHAVSERQVLHPSMYWGAMQMFWGFGTDPCWQVRHWERTMMEAIMTHFIFFLLYIPISIIHHINLKMLPQISQISLQQGS